MIAILNKEKKKIKAIMIATSILYNKNLVLEIVVRKYGSAPYIPPI